MNWENRIAKFFNVNASNAQPDFTRFCVNPFPAATRPWQLQLYQVALERAQRHLQETAAQWSVDDWCI